jgi:hypothetical protein
MFFDIETQANPENLALMPDPKPPANLKDPAKIEAAVAEKKAELIEQAALDPDYGKVLSYGYATQPNGPITVVMAEDVIYAEQRRDAQTGDLFWYEEKVTEAGLLKSFWGTFSDCRGACVGFNILSFDLPFLLARSMYLGVKIPCIPVLARFRTDPVTDLYAIRYNWGPGKGLKQVCRLLDIENNCPEMDGSKVKVMTRKQLYEYQVSDMDLVQKLYQRMNGVYFIH